jgi:hypothetical protein
MQNEQHVSNLTKEQHDQIVKDGSGYEPSVPIKRTYLPLRKKHRLWGGVMIRQQKTGQKS